jgi:hypothetical protein
MLLLLVLGSSAAGDADKSGYPVFANATTLRTWCLGKGAVRSSCLGYLAGVVDTLRGIMASPQLSATLCLPPKLAGEQVRLLFLNHMHRYPERGAQGAARQVHAALADAFACSPPPDKPPLGAVPDRISRLSPLPLLAFTLNGQTMSFGSTSPSSASPLTKRLRLSRNN